MQNILYKLKYFDLLKLIVKIILFKKKGKRLFDW